MEIYKIVKEYPSYEISNFGNVRSSKRVCKKILNPAVDKDGYFYVCLFGEKKTKKIKIHKLVAIEFLNNKDYSSNYVVNHIDTNKQNNNLSNLEIVTIRENSNRKHLKSVSEYVGVDFHKNRWRARIVINKKTINLGRFKDEIDAHNAYQNALLAIPMNL
tara:strand:- start:23 stop:502 length:480 start_codon:yes stop_codon:yes gene_type:complete